VAGNQRPVLSALAILSFAWAQVHAHLKLCYKTFALRFTSHGSTKNTKRERKRKKKKKKKKRRYQVISNKERLQLLSNPQKVKIPSPLSYPLQPKLQYITHFFKTYVSFFSHSFLHTLHSSSSLSIFITPFLV